VNGYAIENAFKACFSKQIQQYDFPEKRLVDGVYTHDLDRLACSPKTDPDVMRVSAPMKGKEILNEREATQSGADHPQAA
jgi:hypothetical protein